jgi:hypothetical protein
MNRESAYPKLALIPIFTKSFHAQLPAHFSTPSSGMLVLRNSLQILEFLQTRIAISVELFESVQRGAGEHAAFLLAQQLEIDLGMYGIYGSSSLSSSTMVRVGCWEVGFA